MLDKTYVPEEIESKHYGAWEDSGAHDPTPQQVFFMYYLCDTCPANGCLRAIPGSHVHQNALHDEIAEPHSREVSEGRASGAETTTRPDAVDLAAPAGAPPAAPRTAPASPPPSGLAWPRGCWSPTPA